MTYKDKEKERAAWRRYYHRHKHEDYFRNRSKKKRDRLRAITDERKKTPCADCHKTFPAIVMEFDHVRGTKVDDIAHLVSDQRTRALMLELEKCEIVCANCHRIRTAKRLYPNRLAALAI